MTNGELAQSTVSVNEFKDTFYSIDPAWYENHGISLSLIVHQRRCTECQAYEAWNESQKNVRKNSTPNWQKEMREIMKSCSKKEDYIHSKTPMVEAVFRLLLKQGNRPMSVTQLGENIEATWSLGMSPRSLSIPTLGRVLNSQTSYGIMANLNE